MTERLAVEANGSRLDEQRFPGRQGRILFAYLVAQKTRPVPRDELAQLLWGDELPATWEKALRVLMTKLRSLLEECGIDGASALTSAFGCYQLTLPADAWIDVDAAAAAVGRAEADLAERRFDDACAEAASAAELARRSFLPGEDGAWVEEQRRDLRGLLVRALECLRDASFASGKFGDALRYANEITELEPFRESSYRALMQAHAAAGNPAEALRAYERCRHFLAEELGVYPSPETEAVYLEILRSPSRTSADVDRRDEEAPPPDPPPGSNDAAPRRRRGRLFAIVAGALLVVAGATAAAIAMTRGNDPPEVLPTSLVRLDPKTYEPTKVVPIAPRADFVFASHGYIWFTRGILTYANGIGVRNTGNRGLWRYDPTADDKPQLVPGVAPCGVAPDPSGDVWVLNCYGSGDQVPTVLRVNRRTLNSTTPLRVPAGTAFRGLVYGGGFVWLTGKDRQVIRLNPRTGRRHPISSPYRPSGLAWAHHALWIPAWGAPNRASSLWRLPPDTERPLQYPYPVTYSPVWPIAQGNWVWLGDWDNARVMRVPADGSDPPARDIYLPVKTSRPGAVTSLAVGGGAVWATVPDDKAIFRIPLGSGKVTRIPLKYYPWGVTVDEDGGVWVTVRAQDA